MAKHRPDLYHEPVKKKQPESGFKYMENLAWFTRQLRAVLAFIALSLVGCQRSETYHYVIPQRTNDGWEVAHLTSENLNTNLIQQLFERINNHTYKNIHSVLVVKNGKLIIEEYFPGRDSGGTQRAFDRDTQHEMHSVTKSINSILIGIAIDQHLISGTDEKASALFPLYADVFADHKRDSIQLKHLLTMSSGLSWDEWTHPYGDIRNDFTAMGRCNDVVRYVLEKPVATKPGAKVVYSGGNSIALGEIVRQRSKLRTDEFADRYLFKPLGISNYHWWNYYTNGVVDTGGGLVLRPRDMAKIGYLYLNGGRWEGKQIVSEEWVSESTKNRVDAKQFPKWIQADGYGYQWWLRSFQVQGQVIRSYHAAGRGGQFIFMFPDFQIIAVFTGWNDNELGWQPFQMVERYILPAAIPNKPKS